MELPGQESQATWVMRDGGKAGLSGEDVEEKVEGGVCLTKGENRVLEGGLQGLLVLVWVNRFEAVVLLIFAAGNGTEAGDLQAAEPKMLL